MFKRIMLAFDGSEMSFRTAEKAFDLARKYDATVEVVTVAQLPDYEGTIGEVNEYRTRAEEFYRSNQERVRQLADRFGIPVTDRLLFGHVGAKLAEHAGEGDFDLVVIGARGHSPLQQMFLGSVSQYVVKRSPCAVLVAKGKQGATRTLVFNLQPKARP